jgi:alpha-D-ribose 1-methylphosphonate 5-triphosphate diphosphatase
VTDIFIDGGRVLLGEEFTDISLRTKGRNIESVGASCARGVLAVDARGLLVLPCGPARRRI